jgi:type VI secretion system secreted protein VgrG
VVGPAGDVVHTDALGRIKVRFLFARSQDHAEAGASGTDADSAWIRQVETWGSQGFGGSFLPRVGDEVAVEFLGGDPDQPIITGSLHNRAKTPASFSEASMLPNEKALSGLRSRMHHGRGGNELVFDDTTAQLRTRIASDHAASHLHLGYLVHPRSGGVGTPRGEGFELRTDAWGVVRAEKGLLLTTYRTSGPQLEADPFAGQLESSLELANALSETGEPLGADKLEANGALKNLKEAAQAKQKQGGREVPAFSAPLLGLASPDGLLSATPASHILSAGDHLHLTSGEDTNLGVGRRLALAIRESWSVFVSKSGIKLFASGEDFNLQAQDGHIQLLADQNAKVTSANRELKVLARNCIKLTAGQCRIEVTDKDVNLYMPGPLNIQGNLSLGGTQTGPTELPFLPKGELEEVFQERRFRARIYLGTEEASHQKDPFTLKSTNGAYVKVRTLKDDLIPGDAFVDLDYPDLLPDTSYTLEVTYGEDGSRAVLFEDVPCSALCTATNR